MGKYTEIKRILIFTFFAPLVGTILSLFPLFLFFGYVSAIIPAFVVGIISAFLSFKNPWANYGVLIILSVIACMYFFFLERPSDFIIPSIVGISTTIVMGYFVFLTGKR
ncbi:MAG: hypothetical protein P8Y35_08440 [Sulfurovaceae bacterium]